MFGAMRRIDRRDFLKISSILSVSAFARGILPWLTDELSISDETKPNIFIFVFDAMSAENLSVYGYPRTTTPFLEKFSERSTVFHSHYSGGNFTTPGTSTLLTGLYPWRNRAFTLGGLVERHLVENNIFHLLGDDYYRIGYSQNVWADLLLRQFKDDLDEHIPVTSYLYSVDSSIVGEKFVNDSITAYYAIDEFLASSRHYVNPYPGSLSLGFSDIVFHSLRDPVGEPSLEYPYGMPFNGFYYYQNPVVFNGIYNVIASAVSRNVPVFGYFHTFSPHGPYAPRNDFKNVFPEIEIPEKPRHPLSYSHIKQSRLNEHRMQYDQYISDVDAEFGRMINRLEASSMLENSYVIVTSDHGETFERGEFGHASALLYEPVTHIPLLVSAPGQTSREDVHIPTNNVDILPTVLHIAGRVIPKDLDGSLLPGFGKEENRDRSIFMLEAKENSVFLPLSKATIAMRKGDKKLVYYLGYPKYSNIFELYDLQDDKEEMKDIYQRDAKGSVQLKDELLEKLTTANHLYVKG